MKQDGYASCEGCLTIISAIPSTLKFFLVVVVASGLLEKVGERSDLECVSLGPYPYGEWFIKSADARTWLGGIQSSSTLLSDTNGLQDRITHMGFAEDDKWLARYE